MPEHEQTVADYGLEDEPDWRATRWAPQQRAVTVGGRRIHVTILGSGPRKPLLLVHGLGGRWQNWLANIPRLAAQRPIVALDLPGFGRSQMPIEPISIGGYARTLERVCDLLELDAPVVVGHSLGGAVACEFAVRFPRQTGALALIDAGLGLERIRQRAALMTLAVATALGEALRRGAIARPRARQLAFAAAIRHPSRIAPDLLYQQIAGARTPGSQAALQALIEHEADGLGQITAPTLVVHGAGDVLVPVGDGRRLAASIPGARLEVFEDCGHMPMLEHPRRFNDLLARFAPDGD